LDPIAVPGEVKSNRLQDAFLVIDNPYALFFMWLILDRGFADNLDG
jgi:hypothetical protein